MKKRFVSLIGVALILCMFVSAASAEIKIKLNTSWGENSSVQTAALRFGELLAEKMGVKCYDKELLSMAAKHSGLCEELFEKHDERPTSSFLYSLVMDSYSMGYTASGYSDMPINHKIFLAQFDTIKKLADEASCVMVGRCADYALEDYPNVVSVFITANDDDKLKRLQDLYKVDASKAKDIMIKTDKQRASYYNYYSNKKWSDPRSYDLCLNSSSTGPEGAVDVILNFAKVKQEWRKQK